MMLDGTNSLPRSNNAIFQTAASEFYMEKCFLIDGQVYDLAEHTCSEENFSLGHIKDGCLHHMVWRIFAHGAT